MRPEKAESPLRLKSRLEPVADRLVEQDPRPARAEHHRHRPRRRLDRAEQHHRRPRRLAGEVLGRLRLEELRPDPPPAPRRALAPQALVARDHAHADREERLHVLDQHPGRARDAEAPGLLGQARDHLLDPRVERPRRAVGPLHEGDPLAERENAHARLAVAAVDGGGRDGLGRQDLRVRRDVGGRLGRAGHGWPGEVVGVGVAGPLPGHDPDPEAAGHAGRGGADDPLLEQQRGCRLMLEVEVGEGPAPGEGQRKQPLHLRHGNVGRGPGALVLGHFPMVAGTISLTILTSWV